LSLVPLLLWKRKASDVQGHAERNLKYPSSFHTLSGCGITVAPDTRRSCFCFASVDTSATAVSELLIGHPADGNKYLGTNYIINSRFTPVSCLMNVAHLEVISHA
jgi:hypothetical protein